MQKEEKLERVIGHYRQKLADEELRTADLTVTVDFLQERIVQLESELEGYRVQSQDKVDSATTEPKYDPF